MLNKEKAMKKINFFIGFTVLAFVGCKNGTEYSPNYTFDAENNVNVSYYQKDAKADLLSFLQDGSSRSAYTVGSEENIIGQMWQNLSDEERQMIKENINDVKMEVDYSLSFDASSSVARSVNSGDTKELDIIVKMHHLEEKIKDRYSDCLIPTSMAGLPDKEGLPPTVGAAMLIAQLGKENDWNRLYEILLYIGRALDFKDLKKDFEFAYGEDADYMSEDTSRSLPTYKASVLMHDVGEKLKNGEVILTNSREKAYGFGKWMHAGIFAEKLYDKNSKRDASHCVYTAQPNLYQNFPRDMKPDRPGYACLDTIFMYTKQQKFCTLLPKGWTKEKAEKAVQKANDEFYDKNPKYHLPWWESFWLFEDTSHDMSCKNTYCSKVVYTAWKSQGINLDSNTFAGNIVSPDDIYDSAIKRAITVTIKVLWWSWSWEKVLYEPQADINLRARL